MTINVGINLFIIHHLRNNRRKLASSSNRLGIPTSQKPQAHSRLPSDVSNCTTDSSVGALPDPPNNYASKPPPQQQFDNAARSAPNDIAAPPAAHQAATHHAAAIELSQLQP
ncbi:hypothetical protein HK405_011439, partial [Cladochytrium tenue]